MKQLIIYGQGDFAKLMYHYFKNDTDIEVVAFCVDSAFKKNDTFCKLPLIDFLNMKNIYPPETYNIFIAVGYSNMRNRKLMYRKVKEKKYTCINYISSKSSVDNTLVIGENNVIMQNVVIEPFVKIGDNNIIWSSCTICHDARIFSHSFIAAQTLIGGFSKIKDNCFLGFNSTVIHELCLEKETLLGAKSLLMENTNKYTKYIGIPAKNKSTHKKKGILI